MATNDEFGKLKEFIQKNLRAVGAIASIQRWNYISREGDIFCSGGCCGVNAAALDFVLQKGGYDVENVGTPYLNLETPFCTTDYHDHQFLVVHLGDEEVVTDSSYQQFLPHSLGNSGLSPFMVARYGDLRKTLGGIVDVVKQVPCPWDAFQAFREEPKDLVIDHFMKIWDYKAPVENKDDGQFWKSKVDRSKIKCGYWPSQSKLDYYLEHEFKLVH